MFAHPSSGSVEVGTASAPVQVIGGHMCTYVPYYIGASDHLEEAVPPKSTLDTTYIVAAPAGPDRNAKQRPRVVRIVATEPETTLLYTPAIDGAPAKIDEIGDYVEIAPTQADFVIEASKPVVVAQYMVGKNYDLGGDATVIPWNCRFSFGNTVKRGYGSVISFPS